MDDVIAIIKKRALNKYDSPILSKRSGLVICGDVKGSLALDSDYSELQAKINISRSHLSLATLFKRQGNAIVQIVSRQFGVVK